MTLSGEDGEGGEGQSKNDLISGSSDMFHSADISAKDFDLMAMDNDEMQGLKALTELMEAMSTAASSLATGQRTSCGTHPSRA